jgi:hypothetical protein
MQRSASLGLIFLLGSLLSPAQSPNTQLQTRPLPQAQSDTACPIAMRARHAFFLNKELIDGAKPNDRRPEDSKDAGMKLLLTLTDPDARQIAAANITVHGTNGNWRLVPVNDGKGSPNVTRTLKVPFEPGENRGVDSYLALRGFTAVSSIVLNSVTYADGSTWKTIDAGACQVAPDPLMLIAGR